MAYVTVGKENSGKIDIYYNDWDQGLRKDSRASSRR